METNPMLEDAKNPNFNFFEEGIIPNEVNQIENRRIILKRVPEKLTKSGLLNILKQFGNVTDLNIPHNQSNFSCSKPGFKIAFATFSCFNETEKAVRDLNSEKNDGLKLYAEIAHERQISSEPDYTQQDQNQLQEDENLSKGFNNLEINEEDPLQDECHPVMFVDYENVQDGNIHEKVTKWERKKFVMSNHERNILEDMKQRAMKSLGNYDDDKLQGFIYLGSNLQPEFKKCFRCGFVAVFKCDLTGNFYCTIKCSKSQEQEKELKNRNQLNSDASLKAEDLVVITAVVNEKCLFVRRVAYDYVSTINEVYKHGKTAQKMQMFPNVGELVLAQFQDEIYRAKVLDVPDFEEDKITIQLIDFGNTARVVMDDLYEMSKECQSLKCFSHKILLKDVNIPAINEFIVSYLEDLMNNEIELTITNIDDNDAVLIDKSTATNVNKRIEILSQIDEVTYQSECVYDTEFPIANPPNGRRQSLVVVNSKPIKDHPEYLCCVAKSEMKDFIELYRSINVYGNRCKKIETGIPQEKDRVFLSFVNNQWHRSVVKKSVGDGRPLCTLIDLCNDQKIRVRNMIPMPEVFKYPPILSDIFKIEGFNELSDEMKQMIEDKTREGQTIIVDVLNGENDIPTIHFNEINDLPRPSPLRYAGSDN
ncbi:CLUMA_CG012869, isoform A [Clunio marinus]|uniref:CLUMA_CG012869, isoform A n=1 Tax=Clunio marinus TaxID=568069 RepID=A0A1J1IH71_9DIPT|nr:CLUMA_CG012869, isoform A [Clunio marinus]